MWWWPALGTRPPDPASLERPWLRSYPPGVPPTYRLPAVPVTRFLDDAVRDFPHQTALVAGGDAIDHVRFRDQVDLVATALVDHGIGPGDRVLVVLPNLLSTPVVMFAVWRVGAVLVPLDPETRPDRVAAVAEDAEVVAVVAPPQVVRTLADHAAAPAIVLVVADDGWIARHRRRFPRLGDLPGLGRRSRPVPRRRASRGLTDPGVPLAEALVDVVPRVPPPPPDVASLALLAYRPRNAELRGVRLTHANLVAAAFQARLWIPDVQAGRERVLVADGLHDLQTLVLGALVGLLAAATVVLVDDPDASTLARAIERESPTLLPIGPRRLGDLLDQGDAARRDLTSLRVVLAVGAPVDPLLAADVERRTGGARVREGFGSAEAGPLTHAQPVYGRAVRDSMGLPVSSTVAAVVDPDDVATLQGPGEPGLLAIHGPQVADGYWRRDDATAAAFVDEWLITDDLVSVDADGVFRHVGRRDEVFERHGTLISPRHVEATLERHPGVRRAGVVGDPVGGLLFAAVVPTRRNRPGPDELLTHCRVHLDWPAVPDRVTMVDELPETDAGDLARDVLRHQLAGR